MATKENPGEYDCYAKLQPHEEYFLLRARDPSMPYLVRIWVCLRKGNPMGAIQEIILAWRDPKVVARACTDKRVEKFEEAVLVSFRGEAWHQKNVIKKEEITRYGPSAV